MLSVVFTVRWFIGKVYHPNKTFPSKVIKKSNPKHFREKILKNLFVLTRLTLVANVLAFRIHMCQKMSIKGIN